MASPSPSRQGSPGAAGLLQGSRARSYGSLVKSVSSPVRERRVEHHLRPGDTLQGLAVMYGVTVSSGAAAPWEWNRGALGCLRGFKMEQIKRANRLYTNDSIFLKKTLSIPVPVKPKALSNSLSLEEEEEEEETEAKREAFQPETPKKQKPPRKNGTSGSVPKHDLSATDFLFRLDSEIRRSKHAAAKKLHEGESMISGNEFGTNPTPSSSSSYQSEPSPRAQQRTVLGPVPLTRIARANTLRDQEDEIFKL